MVGITNHCTRNSQAFEFLAVVCARLGAVIRHEDHLLSCGDYQRPILPTSSLMRTIISEKFQCLHCSGEEVVTGP
jgi:hypothetical protein